MSPSTIPVLARLPPIAVIAAVLTACTADDPPPDTKSDSPPAGASPAAEAKDIAGPTAAETALARAMIEAGRPDLALAIHASTPEAPASVAAIAGLLESTRWHIPAISLDHPGLRIDHLALQGDSLWVAIAHDNFHTIVRWDLATVGIAAVLAPDDAPLRALRLSPDGRHLVVARGDVSLLVDAVTLAPRADLGRLPDDAAPESLVVFSANSVFFAHPADGEQEGTGIWQIRDAASGEIIRTLEETEPGHPPVLASHLDMSRLRLLAADGTLIDAPVSPVEPVANTRLLEEPANLLHAHFGDSGDVALAVVSMGPLAAPEPVAFHASGDSEDAPAAEALALALPRGRPPGIATGLLRHVTPSPIDFTATAVRFPGQPVAPIPAAGGIAAIAPDPANQRMAVADAHGKVTVHRAINPADFPADGKSLAAIAAARYDRASGGFEKPPPATRAAALAEHSGASLAIATAAGRAPLWRRIASSIPPDSPTLPDFLALAAEAAAEPWHQALADILDARENNRQPAFEPWSGLAGIDRAIDDADADALASVLAAPAGDGPAAAHALARAIHSNDPAIIATALDHAASPPAEIRAIAISHILLNQGNTAAAFEPWIEGFPDLAFSRKRADWDGWEQSDFQPAVLVLEEALDAINTSITIRDVDDEAHRRDVIDRLLDPATAATIGTRRFADACLAAATVLAETPDEIEATFQLAALARNAGAPPAPCLRAEALALTALGDHPNAHTRWIKLITEHPVEHHQPGDYAEAAYTAFENADSRQAIEILITGIHRFEGDANFALRAGWVALLTGNPDHAQAFLLKGQAAGFPDDTVENATALLAIAAVLNHDSAAALAHFHDLITIDPDWADPETIESLPWPEHLKAPLRQLTW